MIRICAISHKAEGIVTLAKPFWGFISGRLYEKADAILQIPAMRYVVAAVHIVYIVFNFSTEVQIIRIPGHIVPGLEVVVWMRFIAVVGESVPSPFVIPERVAQSIDIPNAIVEGKVLPFAQLTVNGWADCRYGTSSFTVSVGLGAS